MEGREFELHADWDFSYLVESIIFAFFTVFGDMIVINDIDLALEALVTKTTETAGRMQAYSSKFLERCRCPLAFHDLWSGTQDISSH